MCDFTVIQTDHILVLFVWFWYEFEDTVQRYGLKKIDILHLKCLLWRTKVFSPILVVGLPWHEFICLQLLHRTAAGALLCCFTTSCGKYYRPLRVWKMTVFFRFERAFVTRPGSCAQSICSTAFISHYVTGPDTGKGSSVSAICLRAARSWIRFGTFPPVICIITFFRYCIWTLSK